MLTAGGRLLSSALVGRGCFPSFSALVGRVGGWRSSGCAVMSTQKDKLRLRCLFCVPDVVLSVRGYPST